MRTVLCTIYGLAVGVAYAALLHSAIDNRIVSATAGAIIVALVPLYGWRIGSHPEPANVRHEIAAISLIPLVCLCAAFILSVFSLLFVISWPFLATVALWNEWRFRRRMRSQGRFATAKRLRPRLQAGEGTLIVETGHKGSYRVWWAADDLLSLGRPVSTKEELTGLISGRLKHEFNERCLKEYLDNEHGKAHLTTIPARHIPSGRLARQFPQSRIVQVVQPLSAPSKSNANGENGVPAE
jgi:hypothetical protein